jgi:hypothetical protein
VSTPTDMSIKYVSIRDSKFYNILQNASITQDLSFKGLILSISQNASINVTLMGNIVDNYHMLTDA